MKSFISVIYLQTNSVSCEKIAVGLLGVSEEEVFFQVSDHKIKTASKLSNQDVLKHAEISFGLISNKVVETNKEQKAHSLLKYDSLFTKEYISYLNQYSKGLIQFDIPKSYAGLIDNKIFKSLFQQFVGDWGDSDPARKRMPQFNSVIKKKLDKPVFREKADIGYTLSPETVQGLLKPQDITLISKNGNILAAQAVDFRNSEEVITKHTYEYEVMINSLEELAQKKISKKHKGSYYLLFNKPVKTSGQEKLLNQIVKSKSGIMIIEEASYLDELENTLKNNDYYKFSQFETTL